ncbi:MAG: cysteine hydrolase [Candidatus Delongbacteria bacterium]
MATVRDGARSALLIVDVQVGVMRRAWEAARVIGNVALAVERARAAGVPVIWVQHEDEELVRDSADWRWVPELRPASDEVLIHKHFNSAFEETVLEERLAELGITQLVLAGASSNWCIRATAYGALERGYDLTLVEDAHSTASGTFEDGMVIEAAHLVRELNLALTWLSYPGRVNRTLAAGALDFASPGGGIVAAAPTPAA